MGSKASTSRCELCHENLLGNCIWCKNYGTNQASTECQLVEGVCGHEFHEHCLQVREKVYQYFCAACHKDWQVISELK